MYGGALGDSGAGAFVHTVLQQANLVVTSVEYPPAHKSRKVLEAFSITAEMHEDLKSVVMCQQP